MTIFSKIFILIFIVIFIPLAIILFSTYKAIEIFENDKYIQKDIVLEINKGDSLNKIVDNLAYNKIIRYKNIFYLNSRVRNFLNKTHFKAGEYIFTHDDTPLTIYNKLVLGKSIEYKFTLIAGTTKHELINNIKNNPYLSGDITVKFKEGDLLPDTYHYHKNDSRDGIITRMKQAMQVFVEKNWDKEHYVNQFIKNNNDVLTLASIIEKETGIDGERNKVASVFINRIIANMKLQTDPTVIYAITKGEYILDRYLTFKDLKIKSEYNTYHVKGLPPTPIAFPSKESILAIFEHKKTNYYYFVANGYGGHIFATNYDDHKKNVKKYYKYLESKGLR